MKCKYPDEICGNMTVLHGIAYCDSVPCSLKDELPDRTEAKEMKVRSDFVTNSSSSSFVLAFKDDADFKRFAEKCNDFGYKKLFKLVKRLIESGEKYISKEYALNILHGFYEDKFSDEVLDKLMLSEAGVDNRWKTKWELRESDLYKKIIEEKLAETDYPKKKKEIEDAEYVVSGMIWDSAGGLLEWAIRNGFLESEFREVCKVCWNIG